MRHLGLKRWLPWAGLVLLTTVALADKPVAPLVLQGAAVQGGLLLGQVYPGRQVRVDDRTVPVDEAGRFLVGIGRDDQGVLVVTVFHRGREVARRVVPIVEVDFPEQHIEGLPADKVSPPAELLERIAREAARVRQARAESDARAWWVEGFIWPARGPISGVYGSRRILNGQPRRPHYGVDVAAPEGAPVVAPAAGWVRLAEPDLFYSGGTVIIDHGLGLSSSFLHLSQVDVEPGQWVRQGQHIGAVGATGRATGPHLDWRMNWLDKRIDPRRVLVLLPASEAVNAEPPGT